jgi:hypothetical protein
MEPVVRSAARHPKRTIVLGAALGGWLLAGCHTGESNATGSGGRTGNGGQAGTGTGGGATGLDAGASGGAGAGDAASGGASGVGGAGNASGQGGAGGQAGSGGAAAGNPWINFDPATVVARSNIVLATANAAATQFMPVGNGSLGAAVWAAGGITAQLNRVDTFPDRKSLGWLTVPGLAS